jgi:hypothetical protein
MDLLKNLYDMKDTQYSEREKYIISLYKELIKEKDEEINRLKAVIEWNAKLDSQKMLSFSKDEIVFHSLREFGKNK